MAHFAKIENGIVVEVIVIDNAHETNATDYLAGLGITGTWIQTSYSAAFGKKFAGVGDTYNNKTKEFKPAQPFPSWTWNAATWGWLPPTPRPTDDNVYEWREDTQEWAAI